MIVVEYLTLAAESTVGAFSAFLTLPAYGYLRVLTLFGIGPDILALDLFHKQVVRYARTILLVILLIFLLALPWDYLAIRDRVWYFVDITNVWFFGIPLEEYLFFIFYVFAISTITVILKIHWEKHVRTS